VTEQATRYPLPIHGEGLASLVPCSHGAGCPLGVDAPAIAHAVRSGDHARAYLIARGPNPFASTCGHGCHAPCETACRRRHFGAPVAIGSLEAYASGFSTPALFASPEPCTSAHDARSVAGLVGRDPDAARRAARSGRRVAVIGAGVSGLACAHDLALLGHGCVLYDSGAEPGGIVTSVIPGFRFPTAAARAECAAILSLPLELIAASRIEGRDQLRALLAAEFDAIFLAIGASAPAASPFPEQPTHPRVVDAMALLTARLPLSGRVVVVGDGDLAVDAARLAMRRPRSEDAAPVMAADLVLETPLEEASINPELIAAAMRDGVAVHSGWRAKRWIGTEEGLLTGVEIVRNGPDRLSKVLACDDLVTAPRRVPRVDFGPELALDGRGYISVDPDTYQTSMPGVWAGGACALGHRSIAHAAADGKRAAWHIHSVLTREPIRIVVSAAWVEADDWSAEDAPRALVAHRIDMPISAAPPADPFSSSALRDAQEVAHEAERCFDCTVRPLVEDALCTRCGKCVGACPVGAFAIVGDPKELVFDEAHCHRCGACVGACPESAIALARAIWEERLESGPERVPQPAERLEDSALDESWSPAG